MNPIIKKYIILRLKEWYEDDYHHLEYRYDNSFDTLKEMYKYISQKDMVNVEYIISKEIKIEAIFNELSG